MKKNIAILSLLFLFSIAGTYAKTIVVYRTKVNGGINGYSNTSRSYESYEDLLVVHVNCWESGSLNCPNMAPVVNPRQTAVADLVNVDIALADFCNNQLSEADASIANGVLSFSNTFTTQVMLSNGTVKHYNVSIDWNCNTDTDTTVHLQLEEINP